MRRARIFQIAGFFIFFVLVAGSILFVEGYLYDPIIRDLVKKGVVYFSGVSSGDEKPILHVDGEVRPFSFPGELRLAPGPHALRIEGPGFRPFEKKISVSDTEILRFPKILLFPEAPEQSDLGDLSRYELGVSNEGDGVFLFSRALHYLKFFPASGGGKFQLRDVTTSEDLARLAAPVSLTLPLPIGQTFHVLAGKEGGRLQFCDVDIENCNDLGAYEKILLASREGAYFFTSLAGRLILIDFGSDSWLGGGGGIRQG